MKSIFVNYKLILLFVLIITGTKIFSQNYSDRDTIGKIAAIAFVKEYTKNAKHSFAKYHNQKLVRDSLTAVEIAEIILFKAIGEQEIKNQRPYEVYFISNFWYLRGTKVKVEPGSSLGGGQFNIIIDSYDSKVILMNQDE